VSEVLKKKLSMDWCW